MLRLNPRALLSPKMGQEMPVTTKAQLYAESEEGANSLNSQMRDFLSKIKKSAKSRDIPNGSLTPTCGELFLSSRTRGHPGDGLKFLRDRALELNLL